MVHGNGTVDSAGEEEQGNDGGKDPHGEVSYSIEIARRIRYLCCNICMRRSRNERKEIFFPLFDVSLSSKGTKILISASVS